MRKFSIQDNYEFIAKMNSLIIKETIHRVEEDVVFIDIIDDLKLNYKGKDESLYLKKFLNIKM